VQPELADLVEFTFVKGIRGSRHSCCARPNMRLRWVIVYRNGVTLKTTMGKPVRSSLNVAGTWGARRKLRVVVTSSHLRSDSLEHRV